MPATVAELCRVRGIELAQLVEQSGLEATRVEAILMSRWTPSPSEREKIAAALGVAMDEISWGHAIPIQHLYGHGPG